MMNSRRVPKKNRLATEYLRVCDCGDEKWVSYKPKPFTQCTSCASKKLGFAMSQNNIKTEDELLRYEHKCTMCDEVRYLKASTKTRKSTLCSTCSRKYAKKKKNKDGSIMRFYRICCKCDDVLEVKTAANAKPKYCRKCAPRASGTDRKQVKNYKKRTDSVSQLAIDRVRKINKEHKAIQLERKKKPIPKSKLSYEDMVSAYLVNNEVKILSTNEPEWVGHKMSMSGSRGGM